MGALGCLSVGTAFFRALHSLAFRVVVDIGDFLHDLKLRRNEFQVFYDFLRDHLIFCMVIHTITVFSRQFVLDDFACLKGGKVFLFFRNFFLLYGEGCTSFNS